MWRDVLGDNRASANCGTSANNYPWEDHGTGSNDSVSAYADTLAFILGRWGIGMLGVGEDDPWPNPGTRTYDRELGDEYARVDADTITNLHLAFNGGVRPDAYIVTDQAPCANENPVAGYESSTDDVPCVDDCVGTNMGVRADG